ncbi:Nramp family divalent metal transporter [Deinococcus yavapaiensis]|uniref:Divalent metal cation transporter MntH n=1 Tax=Deinococcus yavapaiensis KR-236 TaxID=694435 RepID=A0A318S7C6_9DEIO|nr:Nramp family divalent metal transporter [Deinococcus yavapaiensis]PYE53617.1 manganese transport protein [Deinococcus yavapaiensis KR-236]
MILSRRRERGPKVPLGARLAFLGPALVASVAYMDPGNFAANISGGAAFGTALVWVVVAASLMAILVQILSAKLGLATGASLPELIRDTWPDWASKLYWAQAELVAMATDLAEFLGASIALQLLLHWPLWLGAIVTAVFTFALLAAQGRKGRVLEIVVGAFVGFIALCYVVELALSHGASAVARSLLPHALPDGALLLAVSIVGATVMPHVIYLHGALTKTRHTTPAQAKSAGLLNAVSVTVALLIAGFVNVAMLGVSAATFHATGHNDIADLATAYHTLTPLLGGFAATVFGVALLASGLSSSVVGTLAGQIVMEGFTGWKVPLWLRRLVTLLPAVVVILLNVDPTRALVWSQVALSFGIPFALVPLLIFTSRSKLMGSLVNTRLVTLLGAVAALLVIGLNVAFLVQL